VRPVPIPNERLWQGTRRLVVGPAGGDPTDDRIRAVEVLSEITDMGHVFWALIALEPGDIERLQQDPHFWLSIFAPQLVPFNVDIERS
jgi:hypothetical protein